MGKRSLDILFENEDFVVVNKVAGMLSIPDRFRPDLTALSTFLKRKYGEIFVVHRLDRDTSGIMLFAKHKDSHKILNDQFAEGKVKKEYLALVNGQMSVDKGDIDLALMFNTDKKVVQPHKRGKASKTSYEVVERFKQFSFLRVKMHTGRMHQVRVHLQSIFHPLIVDSKYGGRESFFLSEIKRKKFNLKKEDTERALLKRHPLHADKITFKYNTKAFTFSLDGALPKDMKATLNQLRKLNKLDQSIF